MTNHYVPTEEGYWVNEKYLRISEIIKDYDPTLELAWIPPERQAFDGSDPYAVVHRPEGLAPYIVFTIKEEELDERVLARVFRGDLTKQTPLTRIESLEAAKEAMRLKEKMELAEERQDLVTSIVKSPLHSYKHNGKVFPK